MGESAVGDLGHEVGHDERGREGWSAPQQVFGWCQWQSCCLDENIVAIKNMNVAEAEANSRSVPGCSGNLGGSGGQVVVIGDG